tara:strand:+ start:306 stop:506 length:201 start_codon:yes stop_codon:yes gene_type:complete
MNERGTREGRNEGRIRARERKASAKRERMREKYLFSLSKEMPKRFDGKEILMGEGKAFLLLICQKK